MNKRLPPEAFSLPVEQIKQGLYSDIYFFLSLDILRRENRHPHVLMQVFQRQHAVLCGIDEAVAIIKTCADRPEKLAVKALHDGDVIAPWETVLTIEGDLADFVHLETVYLGVLARQSKVATNVRRVVDAAQGKPVLFFASRYDQYGVQRADGYAAHIGGAAGVSTRATAMLGGGAARSAIPDARRAAL